jgi:hypothetical protein
MFINKGGLKNELSKLDFFTKHLMCIKKNSDLIEGFNDKWNDIYTLNTVYNPEQPVEISTANPYQI